MLDAPDTVRPHIIGGANTGGSRHPGFRCPEPKLLGVPNGVVEAGADGNPLVEHSLLRHARHHAPGGAHPGLLALGGTGVDGPRVGHDVHHALGPRVEKREIIVIDRAPGAHRVGCGHNVRQPQGLGIPLPAQLVTHDAFHACDAARSAAGIDVVIASCGVPKV